ncbi:Probable lipoprotein precursor [Tenacibaculum maritimum]|nr:DUF6252 family protein [Tenacibaculum maritimum]MCD9583813.1 DUF6252 family protein [Tenacibaculum maritimum]MCD9619541.1 DUF6252 family protein [Tenacibaculum maritimum]MCD9628054.1 DUF6252 family protein [Tenacibaculum maritimum]MCD9631493.1 DUF6252 family protein [Tenacibaculum maritimum]MCD9633729.1 DUF6252 family protein [Tenacibaculum maritimum]
MKKTILLIGILLTTFLSCSPKEAPTLTPLQQLPKATKVGANTAGCLVNGEAFLPKGSFSIGNLNCYYIDQNTFSLRISQQDNGDNKRIYIYIGNTTLEPGKTYQLKKENGDNSIYAYYALIKPLPFKCEIYYQTNEDITGEVTITHHNYDKATISGTFWFDAILERVNECDPNKNYEKTFKVREGRFDMKY